MSYEMIEVRTEGDKVGVVTLNRPKQLNALNNQLMDELGAALRAFDADAAIGCMIVTGSEKAFAAGADIGAMATYSFADVYKGDYITRNWETIRSVRKPVIAAVSGFALGGGCELAMMCDFIIAADNAKFGQPEIKLGKRTRTAAAALVLGASVIVDACFNYAEDGEDSPATSATDAPSTTDAPATTDTSPNAETTTTNLLSAMYPDGLRDVRYCEVLLLNKVDAEFIATVWGSQGQNDCPQADWEALDAAAIAAERGALLAVLNRPRHWTLDAITANTKNARAVKNPVSRFAVKSAMKEKTKSAQPACRRILVR